MYFNVYVNIDRRSFRIIQICDLPQKIVSSLSLEISKYKPDNLFTESFQWILKYSMSSLDYF